MAEVQWTDGQRAAITRQGENLLVSAGAGSGKTTVLIRRIIERLLDPERPVDVDRLLVVTYTRAAAAEMRSRLAVALRQAMQEDPGNRRLEQQLVLLQRAQITTLHSFCLDTIKKYFYLIDIDPKARVAGEAELYILQEQVMNQVLEAAYDREASPLVLLLQKYSRGVDDEVIRKLIRKIVEFSYSMPTPLEWISQLAAPYEQGEVMGWISYVAQAVQAELAGCLEQYRQLELICGEPASGLERYATVLQAEARDLATAAEAAGRVESGADWDRLLHALAAISFGRLPSISAELADEEMKGRVQAVRTEIKSKVKRLVEQYGKADYETALDETAALRPLAVALSELALEYVQAWQDEKRSRGYLEFADLEHYCLAILQNEEVRAAFREEFVEVFVDEYQDINRVQEAILDAVSTERNRFMVGDIKQSIYSFRMAEPSLFLAKYKDYGESTGGSRIDLMDNFRSQSNVIDAVNFVFRQLLVGQQTEVEYDRAAELLAGNETLEPAAVELLLLDKNAIGDQLTALDDSNEGAEDAVSELVDAEREALVIAARIKELVAEGYAYKDIVILLRSVRNTAGVIRDILGDCGIPCQAEGMDNFFDTTEIELLLNLLKVIDNPLQDICLAAVLHSPLVGLSLSELAELRLLAPNQDLYAAARLSTDSRVLHFCEQLAVWRQPQEHFGMVDFLKRLFADTGYVEVMSALPGGEIRLANLNELLAVAADYDHNSYRGLYRFIGYLEHLKAQGKVGKRSLKETAAVTVMSIHRSKGLEFPVVIIAGIGRRFNRQDLNSDVLLHRQMGLGMRIVDAEKRIKYPSLGFRALAEKVDWEQKAEEMRILYVAMTRAKERLILLGSVSSLEAVRKKTSRIELSTDWQLPTVSLGACSSYLQWLTAALCRHRDGSLLRGSDLDLPMQVLNDASRWQVEVISQLPLGLLTVRETDSDLAAALFETKLAEATVSAELAAALDWDCIGRALGSFPIKWTATAVQAVAAGLKESMQPSSDELAALVEQAVSAPTAESGEDPVTAPEPEPPSAVLDCEQLHLSFEGLPAEPEPPAEAAAGQRAPSGYQGNWYADLGTAAHYLLEKLDLWSVAGGDPVEYQLMRLLEAAPFEPSIKAAVNIKALAGFFASPLGQELLTAVRAKRRVLREANFILSLPMSELTELLAAAGAAVDADTFRQLWGFDLTACADQHIFFQGMIDLAFESEGGMVLVDYKSGCHRELDEAAVRAKYGAQILLYEKALTVITGQPPLGKYIHFTGDNRTVAF